MEIIFVHVVHYFFTHFRHNFTVVIQSVTIVFVLTVVYKLMQL